MKTRNSLLSLPLLLIGCGAELDEPDEPELTAIELVGGDHVPVNGISKAQLIGNDIIATPDNREVFISNPLDTVSLAALPGPFQVDAMPSNRTFVRYTVECALLPEQQVGFAGETYTGMLGVCPAWHDGPPTTACLEAVSACLLGRENKLGRRVGISPRMMRTDDTAMPIGDLVPADSYSQFGNHSAVHPITSFGSTCGGGVSTGEHRNCHWKRNDAWVGICAKNEPVSVGIGARVGNCGAPLGEAFGDPVMRVCAGWAGCNTSDGADVHLGSAHDTCVSVGENGAQVHGAAVDFTCPSSGVFTVMLAGSNKFVAGTGIPEAESSGPVRLVATFEEAFTVNEGTFWGNLFHDLNPNVTVTWGSAGPTFQLGNIPGHTGSGDPEVFLFEDTWACHDPRFDAGDAYTYARACSDDYQVTSDPGTTLCVSKPLGPCNTTNGMPEQCNVLDTAPDGDGDRDGCIDGKGKVRDWPMTVFLRGACDLLQPDEQHLCRRSRPGRPR